MLLYNTECCTEYKKLPIIIVDFMKAFTKCNKIAK